MAKRSEAKRAKTWGYTWGDGSRVGVPYEPTRKAAALRAADYRKAGDSSARPVLLVEVRKGEVVLDVKALMDEFNAQGNWGTIALEHALRKVGVR